MEPIRILGICTSPRVKRYTQTMLEHSLEGAASLDGVSVATELYTVAGKKIDPCIGCRSCKKTGKCVQNDDMQELYEKIKSADGIIFATPVYFYNINAQCKAIIDRTYAIQPINGRKVGGIIVTAGSVGTSHAVSSLQMFFSVQGITPAGWIAAYAGVEKNDKAVQASFNLGARAVSLATEMKNATSNVFDVINHFAFGTHTM